MSFELQTNLENDIVSIQPLKKNDFETLYTIASDPLIWEQHPNKNRYQRKVFETFFQGALESKGAFLVFDIKTNEPIGSSRFYDFNKETKTIAIGYTFIARKYWGRYYNHALKALMLEHAFKFVNTVIFHIGAVNIRSQKAIEKLGAKKIGEEEKLNFIYQINKEDWENEVCSDPN